MWSHQVSSCTLHFFCLHFIENICFMLNSNYNYWDIPRVVTGGQCGDSALSHRHTDWSYFLVLLGRFGLKTLRGLSTSSSCSNRWVQYTVRPATLCFPDISSTCCVNMFMLCHVAVCLLCRVEWWTVAVCVAPGKQTSKQKLSFHYLKRTAVTVNVNITFFFGLWKQQCEICLNMGPFNVKMTVSASLMGCWSLLCVPRLLFPSVM